jgi:hypothetical protein
MEKAMHTKIISTAVVFALIGSISTHAQEPAQGSPAEQIIRKSVEDYCTAFNNGDVDSVMGYWAAGADYVDADERRRGKDVGPGFAPAARRRAHAQLLEAFRQDIAEPAEPAPPQ